MTMVTPPPIPPQYLRQPSARSGMGYGTKLTLIALIGVALMVASFVVWGYTSSRETVSNHTTKEIADSWGGTFCIERVGILSDSMAPLASYHCTVEIESQRLHKSIYEAEVYDANVHISGQTTPPQPADTARVFVMETNTDNVRSIEPLSIGGKQYPWSQITGGFQTILPGDVGGQFQFSLRAKGSETICVLMCGKESTVTIDGNCANPSFGYKGNEDWEFDCEPDTRLWPLPDTRSVTKDKFSATWSQTILPLSMDKCAQASFLIGVDRYQKVERSLKYAFLFILFTFLSVFYAERITRYPIPLLNYMLIGLALVLFYVLLLSLCEHMTFGGAYLVASAMTVVLISAYMRGMMHSPKVAATIAGILTMMYSACYVMLCLGTYALLMGSLMMFAALAVSMYASLKIK